MFMPSLNTLTPIVWGGYVVTIGFFFKMTIAHLSNGLLPQHASHQAILRNHMEMSAVLLLSGSSDTAHLSSWTSETLLICFLV